MTTGDWSDHGAAGLRMMGEVLDDRVLLGGGGGVLDADGAEQFICAHCGGPANQRCTGEQGANRSHLCESRK